MRITVSNLQDFLENIDSAKPENVFDKTIYLDVLSRAIGEGKNIAGYEITVQIGCVLITHDGEGQYVLQAGFGCGRDRSGAALGTAAAEDVRKILREYCDKNGLAVRPGILTE